MTAPAKGTRVCVVYQRTVPRQVTVHWEECIFAKRSWTRAFNPEDWSGDPAYYVVGCNHCKPTIT